jgi:succinyl-CoA synthetase beta subunit
MKLHEYQSKAIFSKYGIRIPNGILCSSADEARQAAAQIGKKIVVKSQVLVGDVEKQAELGWQRRQMMQKMLRRKSSDANQRPANSQVLVDEALDIAAEIYLGIVIDRATPPGLDGIGAGGMDIEEVASNAREISRVPIDPAFGLQEYQARAAFALDLDRSLVGISL